MLLLVGASHAGGEVQPRRSSHRHARMGGREGGGARVEADLVARPSPEFVQRHHLRNMVWDVRVWGSGLGFKGLRVEGMHGRHSR